MAKRSSPPRPTEPEPKPQVGPQASEAPGRVQLWFERAWKGWLKPVAAVAVLVLLYFAYATQALSERIIASVLGAGVLFLPLVLAITGTYGRARSPVQRGAVVVIGALWVFAGGYTLYRTINAPAALAGPVRISKGHEEVLKLSKPAGRLVLDVAGQFLRRSEAVGKYELEVKGGNGESETVSGEFTAIETRVRVSRRGSGRAHAEHTENTHELTRAVGGPLRVKVTDVDETMLEKTLAVTVLPAALPFALFAVLAVVLVLAAAAVDSQLSAKRDRTHLCAAVATTLAFVLFYKAEASPHDLVRSAVGSIFLSVVTGLPLGTFLGWVAFRVRRPK